VIAALAGWGAPAASAQADSPATSDDAGFVDVIEVSGHLDPVVLDFVERAVDDAARAGAIALVLQLDSPGAVAPIQPLLDQITDADLQVGVWVGPSGAQASGEAARLVEVATVAALAPGSSIEVDGLRLSAGEAVERGIADSVAPTLGDFIVDLDGVQSREITQGAETRRQPVTQVRFSQLPLLSQLMHTVASPAVAYLLFVIGLALIIFELYTAGVGVAGVVGAGALILGCYGLAVLPATALGIGLLLFAMFGFAVDVQTGVPRLWTAIATVAFVGGSLALYDGVSLSWVTLVVAVVGIELTMLAGMPAMVRTRFSTPTIGREWMVGEIGTAVSAIAPEGVVTLRDAPWRARTNRATPIAAGADVRVASIDGLVLEVEPLEGAARDYRERRSAAP
jgi:membrane-bound serine protease (ClpP class)